MNRPIWMVILFSVLFCAAQGWAGETSIVEISGPDQRAVARTPDKGLFLVKPGDVLPGFGKITEIARGRVVCASMGANGPETVIIRVTEKGQTVERLSQLPEAHPPLAVPVVAEKKD